MLVSIPAPLHREGNFILINISTSLQLLSEASTSISRPPFSLEDLCFKM